MAKRSAVVAAPLLALALLGPGAAAPAAADDRLAVGPAGSAGPGAGFEKDVGKAFDDLSNATKAGALGKGTQDQAPAPQPLRIISWNIRVFGRGVKPEREAAVDSILERMFSEGHSGKVLAIQEVANEGGEGKFDEALPGKDSSWTPSFENTADSQDNAFFVRTGVEVDCERFLFKEGSLKSLHPARVAHVRVGDLDFTIVTLHLSFRNGDPQDSKRELRHVLRWLREYLSDPANDPDVVVAGDFNLPTRRGKESSARSREAAWTPIEDIIEDYPEFRRGPAAGQDAPGKTELFALVDDLTSRRKGEPANNYDHFILTGDLYREEYVEGSAGVVEPALIERAEGRHDVVASDHFPISLRLRTGGAGNDGEPIRPDGPGRLCP
ncbi:MAG: hypothetical protein HY927_09545 [Elusimicrobia bacterium]|nr:hypothetical protein [Elusimicrobiota bacterium]